MPSEKRALTASAGGNIDVEHAADRESFTRFFKEATPPTSLPVFDALPIDNCSSAVWARRFSRGNLAELAGLYSGAGKAAAFLRSGNAQVRLTSRSVYNAHVRRLCHRVAAPS